MGFWLADDNLVSATHRLHHCMDTTSLYNLTRTTSPYTAPHTQLKRATVFIKDQPFTVLFDTGAQLNMISARVIHTLHLKVHKMDSPTKFIYPDGSTSQVSEYLPQLLIRLNAITHDNKPIPLYFTPDFLMMNSHIDMILGVAFQRIHHIFPHYCQDTLIYIAKTGHLITIPLHISNRTQKQCRPYCPFATYVSPDTLLSQEYPFVPYKIRSLSNCHNCLCCY